MCGRRVTHPTALAEVTVTDSPDATAKAADDATEDEEAARPTRSKATDELWEEVGVDPVEIALPRMVGYTLRAYRPAGQLTLTEAPAPEDDEDDPFAARERARAAEAAGISEAELAEEALQAENPELADIPDLSEGEEGEQAEPADIEEETSEKAEEEPAEAEEVPMFLSHRGRLLLFATPELLVSFIGSDAEHDLTQLDTWTALVKRVTPDDIVPAEDDAYELDLVVENLRGGHDAWELPLLISAGEAARDLGWALRLEPVITALAAGSPLDDLDEALRAAAGGGVGGMFARRRLRRIGAQQASLGWRTVIGKISAAVDWRD
jgi:hypothetical protein